VYPGQTFDTAIPLARGDRGARLTTTDIEGAVEAFHRRNEEARLIEARAQEPTVRGIRLVATGLVPQPSAAPRSHAGTVEPVGSRAVHVAGGWHDDVPIYDGSALPAGATIDGPALLTQPFTTIVLRPRDRAQARENGDVLIDVAPPR
jgi:N-methylhydantoinase A